MTPHHSYRGNTPPDSRSRTALRQEGCVPVAATSGSNPTTPVVECPEGRSNHINQRMERAYDRMMAAKSNRWAYAWGDVLYRYMMGERF